MCKLLVEAVAQLDSALILDQGRASSSPTVVVCLGQTLHPKLLLWGLPTVLNVCIAEKPQTCHLLDAFIQSD